MVQCMKENIKMEKFMDKEYIGGLIILFIKVVGIIIISMDMVNINGMIIDIIRVNEKITW